MKKALCLALTALLLALPLGGCSSSDQPPPASQGAAAQTSETATVSATEAVDTELTEKIEWILGCGESEDYYMVQYYTKWMERITEKSGGMITGTIFANAQLGAGTEMFEQLEFGNAHVYMDGSATPGAVNKAFDVFGLPYLFDDKEHQYRFWDNYLDQTSDWLAEQSGIRMVGVIDGLTRETTMRYAVESLDGFQNVKIRVPSIDSYIKIWQALGAAPIPVDFYETFTSIQTGVVDGQENDIALSKQAGFTEVAPYLIMTHHVHYEGGIFFDEAYYATLPDAAKRIIREASVEIYNETKGYCENLEADTLAQLESEGITVIHPDLTAFKEKTKVLYDEVPHCQYVIDLVDQARTA